MQRDDRSDAHPEARVRGTAPVRRRGRVSLVWLIPLTAAAVAGWLGYDTLSKQGPTVTITFRTGEGLEAGKTRVKHKDVELGTVESVTLSDDVSHVVVTARLAHGAERMLGPDAKFWVVRPRVSLSGVSGLGTLISGAYIELDPQTGAAPASRFTGLEAPPVIGSDVAGREFLLATDRLGAIDSHSPIFFRGIRVGEVLGYEFLGEERGLLVHAFVRAPYDQLVHAGTRFRNASGITVSAGADGIKVKMESLEAVLQGGVVFDTPPGPDAGAPAKEGSLFPLYDDAEAEDAARYTERMPLVMYFDGPVGGLEKGSPVELRGLKIGRVLDVHLEVDPATRRVRTPVLVEIEPQRFTFVGAPPDADDTVAILEDLVFRGLRAQLQTGSLLTGAQVVALDFFPDEPPQSMDLVDGMRVVPTVASDMQNIRASVSKVLGRLAALPVEAIAEDVSGTLQAVQELVRAPEVRTALRALEKTLTAVQDLPPEVSAALRTLSKALGAADGLARAATTGVERDVRFTLAELQDAARAFRLLMEYLEAHPESLLRGKPEDIGQ